MARRGAEQQQLPETKPPEPEWPFPGEVRSFAIVRHGAGTKLVAFVLDGGLVARTETVCEDMLAVLLGKAENALLDHEIQAR